MNHGPQLIAFTRAQDESDLWRDGNVQQKSCRGSFAAGQEEENAAGEAARTFYESMLLQTNPERPSQRKRKVPCRVHQPAQEVPPTQNNPGRTDSHKGSKLLKAAQDGDLKSLRRLVEKEKCDVNYRDDYYWTAIMCAAYAGQREAVRYLLSCGAAWVGVCETQGRDAMDLAEEAGHQDVVDVLQQIQRHPVKEESTSSQAAERKYCAVCQIHYSEDTVALHERSTAHLFNRHDPLPPTRYHIPENNVGFQLMVKGGWNQEAGLGPEGTGRKFPIQTILKRDQKGLGFSRNIRAKVTHFDANDSRAVERPVEQRPRKERAVTVGKREARRKEAKAQAWERNLRTYMNLDL